MIREIDMKQEAGPIEAEVVPEKKGYFTRAMEEHAKLRELPVRDEFLGITVLQVVATICLAISAFLNYRLNESGFTSVVPDITEERLIPIVAAGMIIGFLLYLSSLSKTRRIPYSIAVIGGTIGFLVYLMTISFNLALGASVLLLPLILGTFGIWQRFFLPVGISLILFLLLLFAYDNPLSTPFIEILAFAALTTLFIEASHAAVTFTKVKMRVLEYQTENRMFARYYRKVLRQYGISMTVVFTSVIALAVAVLKFNELIRLFRSDIVTNSIEMHSFIGISVTALILFLMLSLVRSAMPQ